MNREPSPPPGTPSHAFCAGAGDNPAERAWGNSRLEIDCLIPLAVISGLVPATHFTVVLICFLHPLLVGLVGGRLGEAQGLKRTMGGMLVAFAGLALAIGFSFDKLNMAGVALAGLSMIACAAVIVGSGHAAKQAGSLAVVFYMMLSAAVTLALLFPLAGTWALPAGHLGWLGLSGVAIGATIGTLTFFAGLTLIGTVRATMLSNLEPVLGILFAMLVLGERIVALQGLGIALVIGAIVALEFRR
jgi:drug/metabolite transporter (DMT)-like permease